jgi:hypothetical protein
MNTEKTIDDRIKLLSEKAKIQKLTAIQATKNKRQSDWLDIQQKTPEIANFMKAYHGVFGKPRFVRIYLNEELFIEV